MKMRAYPAHNEEPMMWDIEKIRSHFPALKSGAVFFDGPGGTQVPQETINAIDYYYKTANSNSHGAFATSRLTDETTAAGREAMADFLNAPSPEEIVFGQNMTSLTYNLSRSIGRTLRPGDEIMVTGLDHDANITPWVALEEVGAIIRWVDIHPEDCTLDMADFEKYLGEKTKIVAVGYSSNAFGTANDVHAIAQLAHEAGAMIFVDAVHFAPHVPIDVQSIDCDFLVCSAYKFFGPHVGILYGKYDILDRLSPYKVRPAGDSPPHKFETGTQNFEGQAGVTATIDYIASIGEHYGAHHAPDFEAFQGRRRHLKTAMTAIESYEARLFSAMMDGLEKMPSVKIYGITDRERFTERIPTVAFTVEGQTPREVAERLDREGIYVWDGHYYAVEPMRRLGLLDQGGAVRVGLSFYNTAAEVDRFLSVLTEITRKKT